MHGPIHELLWGVSDSISHTYGADAVVPTGSHQIPGLSSLIEKISDSISSFVFVTLEPYLKPIMKQATDVLLQGSSAVVNSQDQFRVFNDPDYHHPTHSRE